MPENIIAVHQFTIDEKKINELKEEYEKYDSYQKGRSLFGLARHYDWYSGVTIYPTRLSGSGWYLFTCEDEEESLEPRFYDQTFNSDTKVNCFNIYRTYGRSRYNYGEKMFLSSEWKYFDFLQTIRVGDVILKNKNYHEITQIYLNGSRGLSFTIKSLVTGTESDVNYQKLPKIAVRELSNTQVKNIEAKARDMEKKVELALKNTDVGLQPRRRLGFQSKYVSEFK